MNLQCFQGYHLYLVLILGVPGRQEGYHLYLVLILGVPSGNGQDGYGDGDDGPLDRPGGDAGGSGKGEVGTGTHGLQNGMN